MNAACSLPQLAAIKVQQKSRQLSSGPHELHTVEHSGGNNPTDCPQLSSNRDADEDFTITEKALGLSPG